MIFLVGMISLLALMGWMVDHDLLAHSLPAIANMTFNTALFFLILVVSALLSNKHIVLRKSNPNRNRMAILCALLVLSLALLTLMQDLFGIHLYVDNLIYDSTIYQAESVHPGRMSDLTSLAFILLSLGMTLFNKGLKDKASVAFTHALFILVLLIALLGLSMNLLIGSSPDEFDHMASISTLTSGAFIILSAYYITLLKKRHKLEGYWLLYSGVYVMHQLKYSHKFALISLIFSLPLFVLLSHELGDLNQKSEQIKSKVMAASLAHPVVNLLNEVARHRGMMYTQLVEQQMFSQELEYSKAQVVSLMEESKRLGQSYKLGSNKLIDWSQLEAYWLLIHQTPISPMESWNRHSEIIIILHGYLRNIGRETKIFYDSDPILHNLADAQLNVFPKLSENIGQLRGLGTSIVFQRGNNEAQKLMVASMLSQAALRLSEYQSLSEMIEFESKSEQYKWQAFNQSFLERCESFINLAQSLLVHGNNTAYSAKKYFEHVSDILKLGVSLSHYNLKQTSALLQQHSDQLLLKQYIIKLLIVLMVLVIAYLFAAFYQSVMRSIRIFGSAVECVLHGKEYELDKLSSGDELLTSFNQHSNELLHMNVKLSAIVNHAADGIITFDSQGMIKTFNPAAQKQFGYLESEVCKKCVLELIPECLYADVKHHSDGDADFCGSEVICSSLETIALNSTQREFPIHLSLSTVAVDGEYVFIAMTADLTQQKLLQGELQKAQRAQSVAGLVSGVAHNFNNMLAGIVGQTYLAKVSADDKAVLKHHLDQVDAISEQASVMVKQLLTFSNNDFFCVLDDTSLTGLIQESFAMFKLGLPDDIHLSVDIEPVDMMIHCDRSQIQQMFINIMNNARDALDGASEKLIEVRLHSFEADSTFIEIHPDLEVGMYACLEIIDSGHGMSQATMKKIFDPFFTLKDVGRGTGLGLSAVFGSVGSHNGVVEVDSELDRYSHFKVYLPLLENYKAVVKATDKPKLVIGNGETILLVDDEILVLNTSKAVLQSLGYKVLIANDGAEGLQCFKDHIDEVDAIVSDLVMPNMGGVEMCREIRALKTDIHSILMTGYNQLEVVLKPGDERWLTKLSKPASIIDISQAVQRALAKES